MITCEKCKELIEQYIEGVIADEQLDAQGPHGRITDHGAHTHHVIPGKPGNADKHDGQKQDHFPLDDLGLPPPLIL